MENSTQDKVTKEALQEYATYAHQTILYPASLQKEDQATGTILGPSYITSFPDEWIPDEIEVADAPCFPYEFGSGEHCACVNTERLSSRRNHDMDKPVNQIPQFEEIVKGCMQEIIAEAKRREATKIFFYSLSETRASDYMVTMARVAYLKGE